MTQCPAETVPGTDAVDHLDRDRRDLDDLIRGLRQHPARALLDHGQLHPELQQPPGDDLRICRAHRHLAFLEVADGHAGVRQHRAQLAACLRRRRPERGPVVQVQHRQLTGLAGGQRDRVGRPARLLGQARAGGPEDPGRGDLRHRQPGRLDLQVRRPGIAVEPDREVVRREDLAERHRRGRPGDGGHERVIDTQPAQLGVHVAAERILAGPGDHRRPQSVPGRGHRHVGSAATQELAEGGDLLQRHADLQRVDVDPDPADGQDVVGPGPGRTGHGGPRHDRPCR